MVTALGLFLFLISLSDCKKEENPERDIYIFDIAAETEWDYWLVGKDGGSILLQINETVSSVLYYKPSTAGIGYTILLDEHGIPERTILQDHIILFGNYRKNLVDVSAVLPNGDIKLFKDITINYDFTSFLKKSLFIETTSDGNELFKLVGHAAGVAACVIGIISAPATGGLSLSLTYVGCGTTFIGLLTEYLLEDMTVLNLSSSFLGTAVTLTGCLSGQYVECVLGLTETASEIQDWVKEFSDENQNNTNRASAFLKTGIIITTNAVSGTTTNSAMVSGNISNNDEIMIDERGFFWGTKPDPSVNGYKVALENGYGEYSTSLKGLSPTTTYYYIAYASNSKGIAKGRELVFKTYTRNISDIENNKYFTIKIGNQEWTAQNLRTTTYNDSRPIRNGTSKEDWSGGHSSIGLYCYYNNFEDNIDKYGILYNGYTVEFNNLCPVGWHVPSYNEFKILETYLTNNGYGYQGSGNDVGKSLASQTGWSLPLDWTTVDIEGNVGNDPLSNNSSGFSGLPAGYRDDTGKFEFEGLTSMWWTSTPTTTDPYLINYWSLEFNGEYFYEHFWVKKLGLSVRCIKD